MVLTYLKYPSSQLKLSGRVSPNWKPPPPLLRNRQTGNLRNRQPEGPISKIAGDRFKSRKTSANCSLCYKNMRATHGTRIGVGYLVSLNDLNFSNSETLCCTAFLAFPDPPARGTTR